MLTVNIHEAKTHLSRLLEQTVNGEPFIIAKAGKPLVKVEAVTPENLPKSRRLGFMAGEIQIPDDFDTLGQAEIETLFHGGAT